jgi:hypothetical protein
MVLSGTFNPYILKVLYLFGEKEILPVAFEAAKKSGIAFTMWGREYLSFKRKIRVAEEQMEFEPYIVELLSNPQTINEGCFKYDAILWLEWAGVLQNHLDLIFKILDESYFSPYCSAERYFDFLWKIKDLKIKLYFQKNIDKTLFKEYRDKMLKYIEEFK